nr:MAG TPA: hypothetical protein [Caudoviricetes sp.]
MPLAGCLALPKHDRMATAHCHQPPELFAFMASRDRGRFT